MGKNWGLSLELLHLLTNVKKQCSRCGLGSKIGRRARFWFDQLPLDLAFSSITSYGSCQCLTTSSTATLREAVEIFLTLR